MHKFIRRIQKIRIQFPAINIKEFSYKNPRLIFLIYVYNLVTLEIISSFSLVTHANRLESSCACFSASAALS